MALPSHLFRRGSAYSARRRVPLDLVEAIGKRELVRSLGTSDLAETLGNEHGVPVLDGVTCAVGLAEAMVRLRILTSRVGGYSPPPAHKLA